MIIYISCGRLKVFVVLELDIFIKPYISTLHSLEICFCTQKRNKRPSAVTNLLPKIYFDIHCTKNILINALPNKNSDIETIFQKSK